MAERETTSVKFDNYQGEDRCSLITKMDILIKDNLHLKQQIESLQTDLQWAQSDASSEISRYYKWLKDIEDELDQEKKYHQDTYEQLVKVKKINQQLKHQLRIMKTIMMKFSWIEFIMLKNRNIIAFFIGG